MKFSTEYFKFQFNVKNHAIQHINNKQYYSHFNTISVIQQLKAAKNFFSSGKQLTSFSSQFASRSMAHVRARAPSSSYLFVLLRGLVKFDFVCLLCERVYMCVFYTTVGSTEHTDKMQFRNNKQ